MPRKKSIRKGLDLKLIALSIGFLTIGLSSLIIARSMQQGPREDVSADGYGNCGSILNGDFICLNPTECVQCQNYDLRQVSNIYCPQGSMCNNPITLIPTPKPPTPTPVPTVFYAPTVTTIPTINSQVCNKKTKGYYKCDSNNIYQCNGVQWLYKYSCSFGQSCTLLKGDGFIATCQ